MSKYADIMFCGKSGERYCFQSWPLTTRFRPVGAVFSVTKRVFGNTTFRRAHHEVIYIRQTSSLSAPLGTTAQLDAFEKLGANCLCVYPASDEAYRMRVMKDLFEGQSPPLIGPAPGRSEEHTRASFS